MKHVVIEQVAATRIGMSKKEKLLRWAYLIRSHYGNLRLLHGLEYIRSSDLKKIHIYNLCAPTAFTVAVSDPVFQIEGLAEDATLRNLLDFFGITQEDLHEFSCDCGGMITNKVMARRIEALA